MAGVCIRWAHHGARRLLRDESVVEWDSKPKKCGRGKRAVANSAELRDRRYQLALEVRVRRQGLYELSIAEVATGLESGSRRLKTLVTAHRPEIRKS